MSLKSDMKNVAVFEGTLALPVRIFFEKTGPAKYMSHLDLMRCMTRTIRRAGIPIWYTVGFNPHPFMTFSMPLSLGTSSVCETVDMRLIEDMSFDEVKERLNKVLCEGIKVIKVGYQQMKATEIASSLYAIDLKIDEYSSEILAQKLNDYISQDSIIVQKKNKKKQLVDIDIKPHVIDHEISTNGDIVRLKIQLPSGNTVNINPNIFLKGFADKLGCEYLVCDIMREKILTSDGRSFE